MPSLAATAAVFLRLKLSLVSSAFRREWQQAAGLVVGAALAVPAAFGAMIALTLLGRRTDAGAAAVQVLFVLLAVAWTVFPLMAFGVDETLDPVRLRLLPLTRRQVLVGLTVASAVGVAPVATLIVLAGAVTGFAPAGVGALLVVVAAAVQFLLCLVISRAVTTVLASRLRSRRARDVLTTAGALVAVAFALLAQIPGFVLDRMGDQGLPALRRQAELIADRVAVLPFGWAANAIVSVSEGRLLASLGWLAAAAATVAVLGWWWMRSIEQAATATDGATARGDDVPLFPPLLAALPRTRFGATVARELRYLWRVPQLRIQLVIVPVASLGLVIAAVLVDAFPPQIVAAAGLPAALAGLQSLNLFAADRGALWLLEASGGLQRADLAGRNVAAWLLVLPLVATTAVAVAAVTGGWIYVPAAVCAGAVLLAVSHGVGNVTSVLAPQPLPQTANPFASTSGVGFGAAVVQMLAVAVMGLLLVPVAAAALAAAFLAPALLPLALMVSVLYAVGVWWVGLRIAERRMRVRGSEILAALSARPVL